MACRLLIFRLSQLVVIDANLIVMLLHVMVMGSVAIILEIRVAYLQSQSV